MSPYKNHYHSVIIYCEIEALSTFKHITGKKHAEFNLQIELHVHLETFSSFCVFLGNTHFLKQAQLCLGLWGYGYVDDVVFRLEECWDIGRIHLYHQSH